MTVAELRALAAKGKVDLTGAKTKAQIIDKINGKVEKKAAAAVAAAPVKKTAAKPAAAAKVCLLKTF